MGDGYLYRAPNPWVFGRCDHYLVTEAQRDAIVAVLVPRSSVKTPTFRLTTALGISVLALTILSLIGCLLVMYGDRYPIAASGGVIAAVLVLALLLFTLVALNRLAKRQVANLQPILASAVPTKERITNADVLWAASTSGDPKALRRQWMLGGIIGAIVTAAFLGYAVVTWPKYGNFYSYTQPVYFLAMAATIALQAAISFYRVRMGAVEVAARAKHTRIRKVIFVVSVAYLALVIGNAGLHLAGFVEPDYAAIRERNETAAANGDAAAMNRLGWLYRDGKGVAQDYVKAREWYEKGAAAGNAPSMFWMGWLYQQGRGVARDYGKARQWFDKAAALGDGAAMDWIGWNYQNGFGVARDYGKAREWFEKSATVGNRSGMHNLGSIYQNGWGITQDYVKAREWYEKAALAGSALSMNRLGVLYINGLGVAPDATKARAWFEKAAGAGNLEGMQHSASLL
jgi:TPR repeat protein